MSPLRTHLLRRVALALGSMTLVEKQLIEIRSLLTTGGEFVTMNSQGSEEAQSAFFDETFPPLDVYEDEAPADELHSSSD